MKKLVLLLMLSICMFTLPADQQKNQRRWLFYTTIIGLCIAIPIYNIASPCWEQIQDRATRDQLMQQKEIIYKDGSYDRTRMKQELTDMGITLAKIDEIERQMLQREREHRLTISLFCNDPKDWYWQVRHIRFGS